MILINKFATWWSKQKPHLKLFSVGYFLMLLFALIEGGIGVTILVAAVGLIMAGFGYWVEDT